MWPYTTEYMGNAVKSDGVLGVVIAGGRSVRFGGEKSVAVLAGKPLLMWAVGRLQRSCSIVAVNARPGTEAEALAGSAGLPVLHDVEGDAAGPLAGVKVGLRWARDQEARSIAVSPCDVPMLPSDLYPKLIAAAGSGAAIAQSEDRKQPLCSVWPVSALALLEEELTGGRHPATWMMLERLNATAVRFHSAAAFANINTRIDLAVLAGRLEEEATSATHRPPEEDCVPHHRR
jgi:molybdenum cofactor guanylyltransferase